MVYFEEFTHINQSIKREKQIKAGNRKRKEQLINFENLDWNDLSDKLVLFYFHLVYNCSSLREAKRIFEILLWYYGDEAICYLRVLK